MSTRRVLLLNDTSAASPPHAGSMGASAGVERALAGAGCVIVKRVPLHAMRGMWRGETDASRERVRSFLDEERLLSEVDAVVLHAEGTIHHGQGIELLCALRIAQDRGLATVVLNASFEGFEEGLDALARAHLVHAREPATHAWLGARGIASVLAPDAITWADFDADLRSEFDERTVVLTDAHESRAEAWERLRTAITPLLRESGYHIADLPLEGEQWREAWPTMPSMLRGCACVVSPRHHGVYAGLLAGVPMVALRANTGKADATMAMMASIGVPDASIAPDDSSVIARRVDEAVRTREAWRSCGERLRSLTRRALLEDIIPALASMRGTRPTMPRRVEIMSPAEAHEVAQSVARCLGPGLLTLEGPLASCGVLCGALAQAGMVICEHAPACVVLADRIDPSALSGVGSGAGTVLAISRTTERLATLGESLLTHGWTHDPRTLDASGPGQLASVAGEWRMRVWRSDGPGNHGPLRDASLAGLSLVRACVRASVQPARQDALVLVDGALAFEHVAAIVRCSSMARVESLASWSSHTALADAVLADAVLLDADADDATLERATRAVRPGGRIVMLGGASMPAMVDRVRSVGLLPERALGASDDDEVDAMLDEHGRLDTPRWMRAWGVVAMRDPVGQSPAGWIDPVPAPLQDEPRFHLLRYGQDYANPWLVRALVSVDERARPAWLLRSIAERAIADAERRGALVDAGAALCVLAYQSLGSGEVDATLDARIVSWQERASCAQSSPHLLRWRVSLWFVLGLLRERAGNDEASTRALESCVSVDVREFSPLLATKTIDALHRLGQRRAITGAWGEAREHWRRGVSLAHDLLRGPWLNIAGDMLEPLAFGVREAGELLLLATRCALALRDASPAANSGLRHELASAETFATLHARAGEMWQQVRALATERQRLRSWIAQIERDRAWHEAQAAEWKRRCEEAARGVEASKAAGAWSDEQRGIWQAKAQELERAALSSEAWARQLRDERDWFAQRNREHALEIERLRTRLTEMDAWSQEQQRAVAWHDEQRRLFEADAASLRQWIERLETDKQWLAQEREKLLAMLHATGTIIADPVATSPASPTSSTKESTSTDA